MTNTTPPLMQTFMAMIGFGMQKYKISFPRPLGLQNLTIFEMKWHTTDLGRLLLRLAVPFLRGLGQQDMEDEVEQSDNACHI